MLFALPFAMGNLRDKDPNIKSPSLPLHCGDNKKVIAPHFSLSMPHPSLWMGWVGGRGGGGGGGGYK